MARHGRMTHVARPARGRIDEYIPVAVIPANAESIWMCPVHTLLLDSRVRGNDGNVIRIKLALPHAIHEVARLAAVTLLLDQAVDVGVETGKLRIEGARELQILDDGAVETLARDQQRYAGRIGSEQYAGDATFEVVDFDAVDLAVRHARKGVRWLHRRLHVGQIHFRGHPRHVV